MTHDEWPTLPEKIDPLAVYEDGHALIGKEPAIPVTYLLAWPSTWFGGHRQVLAAGSDGEGCPEPLQGQDRVA